MLRQLLEQLVSAVAHDQEVTARYMSQRVTDELHTEMRAAKKAKRDLLNQIWHIQHPRVKVGA